MNVSAVNQARLNLKMILYMYVMRLWMANSTSLAVSVL